MVAVGDVAGFVEVRDVGEFGPHSAMLTDREVPARVHRPQAGGKGELLVLVDLLVAEGQHGVAVHRRLDLADRRGIEGVAQVDPFGARGEERMQRREGEGHTLSLCRRRAA